MILSNYFILFIQGQSNSGSRYVTDASQRLAPLIRMIRDTLELPVKVILVPRSVLDEDSKIPLTSYHRCVAEPSLVQDTDNLR